MSPNDSTMHHVVTVVLVAHDGARWISDVARALQHQTRPVDRVVAVDTGSRDRSGKLLAGLLGNAAVFGADRGTGFGAAIGQALRHRAANAPVSAAGLAGRGSTVEWVWLLHDDCAPEHDALERLMEAAARSPQAAVLGPKVLDWDDRRVIVEAGITIDGSGRRETGLEPNELDQGQHDGERDVLAVGSAGMLVRRDVWDRVGGFDSGFQLFRDDIDFCWRVIAAGYRVRLVTDAVVYHAEALSRRRRPAAVTRRPRRLDRRNALYVLLANLPLPLMLVSVARNVVGSLLRTLILLVSKQPGAAWDDLAALGSVLLDPLGLLSARRRRASGRGRAYPLVRPFIPRGHTVGRLTEIIGTALVGSPASPARAVNDEEALLTDSGFGQRIMTHPGVLTIVALAVIAFVAERSLLRGGWVGGGALVPVHGGAAGLWREYLAAYHDVGIGSDANAPPYVAVLALLSTITAGKPWLAVDFVLLGCVPLAGITAYLAARRVTPLASARMWAACAYALVPVATGAVAAGRLGTAVAFALLPVVGILAGRMLSLPGRRGRQSAWAAGLVVAVTAAFVPLVWALSVAAAVLAFLAFGRGRRQTVINFGIVALVPAVLLAPWTVDLFVHPSLFLFEAGLQRPGLANPALPASSFLLLSPGGPGVPPVWVTVGFGLAGLAALLPRRRRILVATGWGIALSGLLIAITVSRFKTAEPTGGLAAAGWPGVALTFTTAGVVLAAVTAAEPLLALLRGKGLRRIGGAVIALGACSAPALVAGTWVVTGVRGPLTGTGRTILPEFVTASAANGLRPRTLVLRPGPGPVRYTVLRNADPLLGELELAQPASARRRLNAVVAGLVTGSGGDLGDDGRALSQFAIGYVLLPAPVDRRFVRILDGTPGLQPVSRTRSFGLWRVTELAARVRVVEPHGTLVPVASGRVEVGGARAPATGGTLVLAEPANSGWHASLNGKPLGPLSRPVNGWAQGFSLPAGGGHLQIARGSLGREVALWLEALALVVVGVLALPSSRPETAAEEIQVTARGAPGRRSRRKPGKREVARGGRETPRARPAEDSRGRSRGGRGRQRRRPETAVTPHSGPADAAGGGVAPRGRHQGAPGAPGGPARGGMNHADLRRGHSSVPQPARPVPADERPSRAPAPYRPKGGP